MRVDGRQASPLAFDNMSKRAIRGNTEWTAYQIVLDVPREAARIAYGATLAGSGRLWVDDLTLETVTEETPTTDMHAPVVETEMIVTPDLPLKPVNAGFEE